VGDIHHHVVCHSCGYLVDVDCAAGFAPCLTAADDMGFEIDEAEVVYWGHCKQCRTTAVAQDVDAAMASEQQPATSSASRASTAT
jgi:Fur family ferric uptake transcriptional regulator